MSWTTSDVHPAILQTALAMNEHRIKSEYELMSSSGISQGDNYTQLRQKLLQSNIEFVDPDFYPSVGALYMDGDESNKISDVRLELRNNAYDESKNVVVLNDAQVHAVKKLAKHYSAGQTDKEMFGTIIVADSIWDMSAFYFWGCMVIGSSATR